MNKENYLVIPSFTDESGEMSFLGAYAFVYPKRNILLGKNGNIIILSDDLFDSITNQNIDAELWFKLIQRGLALHKQHEDDRGTTEKESILPSFFMIDMTNNCNIGCKYCLREECNSKNSRTLSREVATDIVNYIICYCEKYGISRISIQPWGGEPLLEKELIFYIQDKLKESDIIVDIDIETNGILLTEELVKQLSERHITYGISLDGYEEANDKQRIYINGKGTYSKIINGLNLTKKYYGSNISVLATITKQTLPNIGEILEHFAEDLNLQRVKLNFVHQSGFKDEHTYCVDEMDISNGVNKIVDKIIELNEKGISIMEYNFWIKMINILTNRERDICLSRGCSGGRDMITFDMNGNIFPCDLTDFPEECLGTIYDETDLPELVKKSLNKTDYFAEKHIDRCDSCPWKHFCNGGCTVRVKCSGGQCGMIDKSECAANHAIYPRIIRLIQEKPQLINKLVGYDIL